MVHHHRSSIINTKKRHGKKKENNKTTKVIQKNDNLDKNERFNKAKQVRKNKHNQLLEKKRMGCSTHIPPKVIVLVPFHEQSNCLLAKEKLLRSCGYEGPVNVSESYTVLLPSFAQTPGQTKQRATFIEAPRSMFGMLDVCKAADVILCVFGPHVSIENPCFDELGYKFLTAIKYQGVPSVMGLMHGFQEALPSKKIVDAKKLVQRYFVSEFVGAKILCADTKEESNNVIRSLGNLTPKSLNWRNNRGYVLGDKAEYNDEAKMLAITGYVRGNGISEKHLVHFTGIGDFQIANIKTLVDPVSVRHTTEEEERIAAELPCMDRLRPYDPFENEQTWPTDEELADAARAEAMRRGRIQAAPDADGMDDDEDDDEMDMENADTDSDDDMDIGDGATMGDAATVKSIEGDSDLELDDDELEPIKPEDVENEKKKRAFEFETRALEDLQFPDEVDTPLDQEAKIRFQKYRGLKSFRTAPWDRYEELPIAYSRIWEFDSYQASAKQFRRKFLEDISTNNFQGRYVVIYLKCPDGPPHIEKGTPLVLSTLYETERKVSVVHLQLTRVPEYEPTIKSKQLMGISSGFRRFPARPIYALLPKKSNRKEKFLYQRFFHPNTHLNASIYCPIIYAPSPVLMFDEQGELTSWGSVQCADPKRLIIKRVVLTGYPFRVHKCKAVVRYMFFNPQDIRWFKPVELVTKHGIRGNIKEPLGMHGYMKCQFGDKIKQDDTVCLNLYKRAYPKWYPPSWGVSEDLRVDA